jgi:hypothetical protein
VGCLFTAKHRSGKALAFPDMASHSDSAAAPGRSFSFFIDRGGTFTDVVARIALADGRSRTRVLKVRASRASSLLTLSVVHSLGRPLRCFVLRRSCCL